MPAPTIAMRGAFAALEARANAAGPATANHPRPQLASRTRRASTRLLSATRAAPQARSPGWPPLAAPRPAPEARATTDYGRSRDPPRSTETKRAYSPSDRVESRPDGPLAGVADVLLEPRLRHYPSPDADSDESTRGRLCDQGAATVAQDTRSDDGAGVIGLCAYAVKTSGRSGAPSSPTRASPIWASGWQPLPSTTSSFIFGWIRILASWAIHVPYRAALQAEMASHAREVHSRRSLDTAARVAALERLTGETATGTILASIMVEAVLSAISGIVLFVISLAWVRNAHAHSFQSCCSHSFASRSCTHASFDRSPHVS